MWDMKYNYIYYITSQNMENYAVGFKKKKLVIDQIHILNENFAI